MEEKIRRKYFFWAIIFFGSSGVYIPIVMRIKSDNIFILDEIVMSLSTYAVALTASVVYLGLIKKAAGTLQFINLLLDYIGIIIGAVIYLLLLNYLLSLENLSVSLIATITVLGTFGSFILWFKENKKEDFGTGSLGH